MIGPNFLDDLDFNIGGDFFDHIDDLLDFSSEDVDGGILGGDGNGFSDICPAPQPDMLVGSGSAFHLNTTTNNNSELSTELSVPQEDIAQLEWLSNFVDDSFSMGCFPLDHEEAKNNSQHHPTTTTITTITTTTNNGNLNKESHQFRTSSPVSVLESSSSSSGGKNTMLSSETVVIPGRARSKRPRPSTFNPRPVISLISSSSSLTDPAPAFSSEFASELENFAESHPVNRRVKPAGTEEKKKKKKKMPSVRDHSESSQQSGAVRKCLHCEITRTPQWRAGPLGPKTLCNACGVRYKSGRLFPEYRPAASPTFVASLHSNSHKKVLEMRVKDDTKMTPPPEFLPSCNYVIDYI